MEANNLKILIDNDRTTIAKYYEMLVTRRTRELNIEVAKRKCLEIELKKKEAEIDFLSHHDSLTGIYNRFFYEEAFKHLDTEENLPFSVIISDINGLKQINDTLGHADGDRSLIEATKIISMHLREGDVLARVGGDEFSLLLPRTNNQEAQEIINRIQTSCQALKLDLLKVSLNLSISMGTATKTYVDESLSSISKLAEDYLYRSKLLERESFHSTLLESLRITLFERSHETEEHAARMTQLSIKLGTAMGLSKDVLSELVLLSSLHDIGKMSIDTSILEKADKLTENEWLEMKKHPAVGYRIAMSSSELRPIATYILCHHEHWDGSGYPQGLSGENIPLLARVISIVDAYDAMTNDRSYRKALTREATIAEITKHSGSQFDPMITSLFLTLI